MPPLRPVPEIEGHWLLGSARPLGRAPQRFMAEAAARHGGIAQFRIVRRRVIVIADPELAQQVLVTRWERYARGPHNRKLALVAGEGLLSTEGEPWLKRRRQIQPAFRRETLERLVPVVVGCVERLLTEWQGRDTVPLGADMHRLTMSAMGRMLLSTDIPPAQAARIGDILRDGLLLLRRRNTSLFNFPMWMPTPANRNLIQYRDELNAFVEPHIRDREAGRSPAAPDLLSALLDVRDPETGKRLTHQELVDETKTLFLAGFETTATALTWTLYLLARHPDVAAKWRAEIDAVLAGRAPSFDDLARLPYTGAILYESMRLYPPVYAIARYSLADDDLGGYAIPKDTPVLILVRGVHRAAAWGADADAFRPDRFLADWPRRAFMPFAAGRHLCIGNDFAMVEMTAALALAAQRYRFSLTDDGPVGESARITLVPDREIYLRLERR